MAQHNDIGALGESIACAFLEKKGLKIIERNYWRKWGEIDIVACVTSINRKEGKKLVVHFVEVKSTTQPYVRNSDNVIEHGTVDNWRPEEMLHKKKLLRLRRVIQTYVLEHNIEDWVFDVVVVYIDVETRNAKCKYIKDIVL